MNGNAVCRRFRLNNLVIANIPTVENLDVPVAVPSGMVAVGDIGFAVPIDAMMTNGVPGIVPVRATDVDEITLTFTNASAGGINPADTFDFIVIMFPTVGNLDATV